MKEDLEKIIIRLRMCYGHNISVYEESFLQKTINKRLSATRITTMAEYLEFLENDKIEENCLINSLNINYSEFFRNPLSFSCLEQVVLPILAGRKKKNHEKEIRVWSAACASGQEAYSIAILFEEIIECQQEIIPFRIFASDISPTHINEAIIGNYPESSLNNVTHKRIGKYFTKSNGTFNINTGLKKYIDFSEFDLLSEDCICPPASVFGNFDIIFCNNLLFYYKQQSRLKIINKIRTSLAPDGFLLTGESEREILLSCGFREFITNTAIFQRK